MCEEESSDSGISMSPNIMDHHQLAVVTPEMEELAKEISRSEEKKIAEARRKYEAKQLSEEVKLRNRQRLLAVVNKSKIYADYMKKLLTDHVESEAKAKKKLKKNGLIVSCSEEINAAAAKDNFEKESMKELDVPKQPVLLKNVTLRDYQLEGLSWLRNLYETGLNGILADEMGLGKTVQTISLLCHLYGSGIKGPFLIVAPLSTLPNWLREFETFAPDIPVVLYYGNKKRREELWNNEILNKKYIVAENIVKPVVLTSFEIPLSDENILKSLVYCHLVVDEGHRIKNHQSKLKCCLSRIKSTARLLLTGTPLQNNLTELWALLNFLLPEIFSSLDAFESWFVIDDIVSDSTNLIIEQEKSDKIISILHEILKPFLLRRLKCDVNLKLPGKKEIIVHCPMTKMQFELYQQILDRSIQLKRGNEIARLGDLSTDNIIEGSRRKRKREHYDEKIMHCGGKVVSIIGGAPCTVNILLTNVAVMLKKTVNHPYLIQTPVLPGSTFMNVDERLISSSGKFIILDQLLKKLKERGHRVLLFSTMVKLLDLVESYLELVGYSYRRLDGSTQLLSRKQFMDEFNNDEDNFIFIISTRAGGLGINLVGADTVIILDSDWNPQVDLQAQDRCHRIGQKKPVVVYRLVTQGTIDGRIVTRATAKRKLEKVVIQKGMFNKVGLDKLDETHPTDLEELRRILNKEDHSIVFQTNGTVMSDEQWSVMMDRRDILCAE